MNQNNSRFLFATLLLVLLFSSCRRSKEGLVDNEEELITTLELTFTPTAGGSARSFYFRDIDGPGGAPPDMFNTIVLNANTSYTFITKFLNETETPAVDITLEVLEEADDHEVFYVPAGVNINYTSLNLDSKGLPVGTTGTIATGSASTGSLRVVLKHKPGTKRAGDDVNLGESDVDITFNATIE